MKIHFKLNYYLSTNNKPNIIHAKLSTSYSNAVDLAVVRANWFAEIPS